MAGIYAGLYKVSCDMCGDLVKPDYTVIHPADHSTADICSVCYGKCLAHQKFTDGIKSGSITATGYMRG